MAVAGGGAHGPRPPHRRAPAVSQPGRLRRIGSVCPSTALGGTPLSLHHFGRMEMKSVIRIALRVVLALLIFGLTAAQLLASSAATVSGTITRHAGRGHSKRHGRTGGDRHGQGCCKRPTRTRAGTIPSPSPARDASAFAPRPPRSSPPSSDENFVAGAHPCEIDLTLSPSVVAQQIVVTATGVPTPEAQTGASISVIGEQSLATRRAVEEELRVQPGAQVTSTGQIGALTSLNVRGGYSDMNKVLIDGIPANDIGGFVDFANLSAAGYEKAELYPRAQQCALWLRRAGQRTRHHHPARRHPAARIRLCRRRRHLSAPCIRRATWAAHGGASITLRMSPSSILRTALRTASFTTAAISATSAGSCFPTRSCAPPCVARSPRSTRANAIALYGIPDDGVSREHDTAFGVTLENRPNQRWHNLVRYAGLRLRSGYTDSPTGICYDPATSDVRLHQQH